MTIKRLLSIAILATISTATVAADAVWWASPDYPYPVKDDAPEWLTSQKLNFSRWDGGPLETCKGMLSGWPYFNAPWPDVVDAVTRWYDVETVELASEMGYIFLWLTFSVGYSNELEQHQWDILRPYIEKCHEEGIRAAAYMSSCNMFVDDMFERVPESKEWLLLDAHGEPVPYGAAAYARMGRTTRMYADITHPGWVEYLKRRIDEALSLGFDALEYDNTHWAIDGERSQQQYAAFIERNGFVDTEEARYQFQNEVMKRLFLELYAYAREKKPDVVLFMNINRPLYTIERATNVIATEDGLEPGYYDLAHAHEVGSPDTLEPVYHDEFADITSEPYDPEKLVTNIGRLRLLHAIGDGWKPVLVEFGGRRNGHRLLNQFPPLAFQLAIGEANAALCSLQGYQEGLAQRDLYFREPEVMKSVQAAGAAHGFVKKHEDHFVGARYLADVAYVMDDRIKGREFGTTLARQNVQFEVLFDEHVTSEKLQSFPCVVAHDAKLMNGPALAALTQYAHDGGHLATYGESGAMTLWGQPRNDNPLRGAGPWEIVPNEEALLSFVEEHTQPRFEVLNAPYVLFTLTSSTNTPEGGYVVHLMNYQKQALDDVRIRCQENSLIEMLALDPQCDAVERTEKQGEWRIPKLGVYSMLIVSPNEE